ncbi:palmitoyltransferase DHHC4, putative [Plasmodium ovale]|uniref:protein S-acyltransferase n=1 Tax=Plasmodium ovale TaxID=36330 RepID=A0A1D3U9Q8_PLAOA|nr:palmitoyltransferase DHHC4, putative [Plasmodium ovale]
MKIFKRNKSLERANFDKINNVQIYGENKIHCKGFFVSGPAFLTVISSFLMILIPVAIFHAFTSTWLFEKDIYHVPIFNVIFFVLTIFTFFKTSFMDPGIIPRQKSVLNVYDAIVQQYRETQPPRQKEVLINGNFYKLKYCYTCNIYRGVRTVHCSICDNCVEKFDHHCPWVGNCIGVRNYKYFVYFVFNLYILICITLGASIYKLTVCINNLSDEGYNTEKIFIHIWKMATDSIILIIYTILTLWFVIGLLCYHIYTIVTNQTTYEQIKTFYQNDNPFNIGVLNNIKEILFTKTRPSYINFSNPQLQIVDEKSLHHVLVLSDKSIHKEEEMFAYYSSHESKKKYRSIMSTKVRRSLDSNLFKKSKEFYSYNSFDSKSRIKTYNVKKKRKKEKCIEDCDMAKLSIISNKAIEKATHFKYDKNKNSKISKLKLSKVNKYSYVEVNNDIEESNNYQDKLIINLNNTVGSLYIRNDLTTTNSTNNEIGSDFCNESKTSYIDDEIDVEEFYDHQFGDIIETRRKKNDNNYIIVIKNWEKENETYKNKYKINKITKEDTIYTIGNDSSRIRRKPLEYETKINCFNNLIHVKKKKEYPIIYKKKFPFIRKFKNKSETYYVVRYASAKNKNIASFDTQHIPCEQPNEEWQVQSVSNANAMGKPNDMRKSKNCQSESNKKNKINYLKKIFETDSHHTNYDDNANKLKSCSNGNSYQSDSCVNTQISEMTILKQRRKNWMDLQRDVIISLYNYNTRGKKGKCSDYNEKEFDSSIKKKMGCSNDSCHGSNSGVIDGSTYGSNGGNKRGERHIAKNNSGNGTDKHRRNKRNNNGGNSCNSSNYKHRDAAQKNMDETRNKCDRRFSTSHLSGIDSSELENFSRICELRYAKMYKWKCKRIRKKILRREKIKLLIKSHKKMHLYYNKKNCSSDKLTNFYKNNDELTSMCKDANFYFTRIESTNKIDNLELFNYLIHKHKYKHKLDKNRLDIKKKSKASKFFYFFTSFALIINCINIPANNDND